jgi:hypothetical protein
VALLHYQHYQRRRQKILLRLAITFQEKPNGHTNSMMQFTNAIIDYNYESA